MNAAFCAGKINENEAKSKLKVVLNNLLDPMRKRMEPFLNNRDSVLELLKEGTRKVKPICDKSMKELRKAIGLVDLGITE